MREPGTRPTQGLPGMGDHPTGVSIYAGIVTALLHRERTGEGGMVHTSLLANGLWSAAGIAQGVMADGDMPRYRDGRRADSAMMRVYRTKDERWLQFNMVRNEELLGLLLAAMDALHLLNDERFADLESMFENREAFGLELQAIVETKTKDAWMELFDSFELPVNVVALVEETKTDLQILENRMAVVPEDEDVGVPLVINHPIKVTSVPQVGPRRAPDLGEQADEILRAIGYDDTRIAELRAKNVI